MVVTASASRTEMDVLRTLLTVSEWRVRANAVVGADQL